MAEPSPLAPIQELYDATTHLFAVLAFTHETADLLKPELDYAIRRLIVARSRMRWHGLVEHVDAGLLTQPVLPPPFDEVPEAVTRSITKEVSHG